MMKFTNFCLLLFICILASNCSKTDPPIEEELDDGILKVLMVGNSHTYYNNLPETVEAILIHLYDSVYIEELAPGGYHFMDHVENPLTNEVFKRQDWDVVVLQECADMGAGTFDEASENVYPFADQLINLVRVNSPAEILLYMTHAYSEGATWCEEYPQFCDFDLMIQELRRNYIFLSEKHNARVAPAGMIWKMLKDQNPEIDLHFQDTIHPNDLGSFISALTIATSIMEQEISEQFKFHLFPLEDQVNYIDLISDVVLDGNPDWKTY